MAGGTGSIINPDEEQGKLVEEEVEVKRTLGVITINVPVGKQYRLFKNGTYMRDMGPGRHSFTDLSPFVKYTISVVDAHVRTTPTIIAKGAIPGEPGMPPCHIEIPLRLTYQLQDINTLLMTVKPLDRLSLITMDQATTVISQLRYAEYTQWATRLRDELQRWLQIHATQRTGLQVLEVFISSEPKGQNEADRLMLKKFATIREIETEDLRAEAERRNKVKDAQAIAQAAGAVGLDAAELALGQMEGGRDILAAHLRQEEMRINALGLAGPRPLIREETPPAGALPAAGGTSGFSAGPNGLTPDFPPDAFSPGGATQGPAQSDPAGATLDRDRVNMEIAQLEKRGYTVQHGPAQVNNGQGGVSNGYRVTVFPSEPPTGAWDKVQFELGPTFPQTPPVVMVALTGATPKPWNGHILRNWKNYTRLEDVLEAAGREA